MWDKQVYLGFDGKLKLICVIFFIFSQNFPKMDY